MTAVRYTQNLIEGRSFTIYDSVGTPLDTLVFIKWESSPLIAEVSRCGTRFTLGMEPRMIGVDDSVPPGASFVAIGGPQPALAKSLSATA